MIIQKRLDALGITLPTPPAPVASYVPTTLIGSLLFVSGQLPITADGKMYSGSVGEDVTLEEARIAARHCAINILAQAHAALGNLDSIERVVRLGVFVACSKDFTQQPEVANGASDLMVDIFGEAGKHTRAAVGTNVLPRKACVEIEAIFSIQVK